MSSMRGSRPFLGRTLLGISQELRSGKTTAVQLAEEACAAAEASNEFLNCFITIDRPGAMAAAVALDDELGHGYDRGPLHGIPIAVKDVISTGGLRTTMASEHFLDNIPSRDAELVAYLRRTGCVIMGKTNCHEFSYGIRGDAGALGVAVNPHDPQRLTGGSSSGSAVAVAAGIVPITIGTDTGGSVRVPAALCGVVGFKPTTGSLPTSGIFPLAPSFDTAGIFSGSIADSLAVWQDLTDSAIRSTKDRVREQHLLEEMGITVAAVPANDISTVAPEVLSAFSSAVSACEASGQTISRVSLHSEYDFAQIYQVIRSAEAYRIHQDLLARAPEAYQPETLERLRAGEFVSYADVMNSRGDMEHAQRTFIDRFRNIDVLISPTVPILAPHIADTDPEAGPALLSRAVIWNILGWPAISVPVPVDGTSLPQSVQLIAKPGMEKHLFEMARRVEQWLLESA